MTSYGFRLFDLSIRQGNRRKRFPLVVHDSESTWRYADHIKSLLLNKVDSRERGLPHADTVNQEEELTESTKMQALYGVKKVSRAGQYVTIVIQYGTKSGHDTAMADPDEEEAEDLDISEHYPSRKYRGILLIPDEGDSGILALETISRTCPQKPLARWVTQWSKEEAAPDKAGNSPAWWKLVLNPMIDDDTFKAFLRDSAAQTIYLQRKKVTGDRKEETDRIDIQVEIAREVLRDSAMQKVIGWIRSIRDGNPQSDREAAASMAVLIQESLSDLDFDSTEVSLFNSREDTTERVKPRSLPDVFTYPLSQDVRPDDQQFLAAVRAVVGRTQPTFSSLLNWHDWPQPRE